MFARRAGMSSLFISTARMSFGHARKASMYPRCCVSTAKMSSDGCKEFRRAGETEVFGHVRKASRYALAILHFTTASIFIVWTCSKGRHVSTLLCFNSEDVQKWHQRLRGTQFYTGRRDRGVWACWQWRAGMSLLYCISRGKMSRNGTDGCEELSFTPAGEIEVFGHVGNGEQVCPCYIAFQQRGCPLFAHARKAGMYPRSCVSTARMSRNGTDDCKERSLRTSVVYCMPRPAFLFSQYIAYQQRGWYPWLQGTFLAHRKGCSGMLAIWKTCTLPESRALVGGLLCRKCFTP